MRYAVYYAKPNHFGEAPASKAELSLTHRFLKEVEAKDLEEVFSLMQGEVWSPQGEARPLIKNLGLAHTSMSVGDVAIDEAGKAHVVASFGFKELPPGAVRRLVP